MSWDKESFYNFIIENNVIGFFKEPIKLKSGRISPWYVNWRTIAEDVYLIDKLTNFIIEFVKSKGLKPDCFYGVPEGATKLSIITQYKWAKNHPDYDKGVFPLLMGRGNPKEHGDPKDRFFLGIPRGKIIIIEDTITTGGAFLETIQRLIDLDVNVIAAIVLTNRDEMGGFGLSLEEYISYKYKSLKFYSMSNAIELLPIIYQKLKPGREIGKSIENYFKKFGIDEIKLIE